MRARVGAVGDVPRGGVARFRPAAPDAPGLAGVLGVGGEVGAASSPALTAARVLLAGVQGSGLLVGVPVLALFVGAPTLLLGVSAPAPLEGVRGSAAARALLRILGGVCMAADSLFLSPHDVREERLPPAGMAADEAGGSWFRVQGLGSRVKGLGCRV